MIKTVSVICKYPHLCLIFFLALLLKIKDFSVCCPMKESLWFFIVLFLRSVNHTQFDFLFQLDAPMEVALYGTLRPGASQKSSGTKNALLQLRVSAGPHMATAYLCLLLINLLFFGMF